MAIRGKCHCGGIEFEVSEAPTSVTRCTCTFCAKRGMLMAYYPPEKFKLISARTRVGYSSHPEVHTHFHCGTCGCGTHSDSPVWEDFKMVPGRRQVPVNVRLLEDFDLESLPVTVIDGKNLW